MSRIKKFESVTAASDAAQKAWSVDDRQKTPVREALLICSHANKAWMRFYYRTRVVRDDRNFDCLNVFEAEILHDGIDANFNAVLVSFGDYR